MSETEKIVQFCNLREKKVILSQEIECEIGREGTSKGRIRCLAKDNQCKKTGCKYASAFIGDVGKIDPFE